VERSEPGAPDDGPCRIDGGDGARLPLHIVAASDPDVDRLAGWLRERAGWVRERLTRHGAILLRGFAVRDARAFETVARAIAPALRADYPGTPGNRLTEHVFPASEVSGWFPIAQHCEMSFLRSPPERVFFGCLEPPAAGSGETPLTDCRRVWRDLDPEVLERFARAGIRIVRNYRGPGSRRPRLWSLERWDDLFATAERARVEERCAEEGFEAEWTADDGLRVTQRQPAVRPHPETGEPVWFNQAAAHHLEASRHEYRRIFRLRPSLHAAIGRLVVATLVAAKRCSPPGSLAYDCTLGDGSPIPAADMHALRATLWRHTVITPWRAGDVLAIDNRAVAHGRLPFRGRRRIVACLA
jgi:alpha-ketoglutarate-dependent taurine dioxygenase